MLGDWKITCADEAVGLGESWKENTSFLGASEMLDGVEIITNPVSLSIGTIPNGLKHMPANPLSTVIKVLVPLAPIAEKHKSKSASPLSRLTHIKVGSSQRKIKRFGF